MMRLPLLSRADGDTAPGQSSALRAVLVCCLVVAPLSVLPGASHAQNAQDTLRLDERSRYVPAAEDPAIGEARMAVRMKDFERAVAIWREAAARGNPEAAYRLGVAYRSGLGVAKDNEEATKWFKLGAEGGDPGAQFALGSFYQDGIVVPQDRDEAIRLFGLAARSGSREAKRRLERMQKSGSVAYAAADSRVAANRMDPREALNQAIRLGDLGSVKEAIARGAPIDGAPGDTRHWRPLILAIEHGNLEIVRLLLERGASADRRSRIGEPALVLAVRSGDRRIVRALLSAKASPDSKAVSGYTPLMEAARLGHAGIASDLLATGADPKLVLADGTSASTIARRFDHEALARELRRRGAPGLEGANPAQRREVLAAGPESDGKSGPGMPPVVEAARRGDLDLLREIIDHKIDLTASDSDGGNALTHAAEGGHLDAVKLLVKAGVDPDLPGADGATALMLAMGSTAEGAEPVLAYLLEVGADPHARGDGGSGVMDYAAKGATAGKLETYQARGGSWAPGDMRSALNEASAAGRLDVMQALLSFVQEPGELTGALCRAVEQGHSESLPALVTAGSRIEEDCGARRTPLAVASHNGHAELVEALIGLGADPDGGPVGADTALIAAAGRGHTAIVALLIEKGADVDRRGASRMTPLMAAATNGHAETTEALLEAGADRGMRSETKLTALDFARQSGDERVAELIESFRPGWRNLIGFSRD